MRPETKVERVRRHYFREVIDGPSDGGVNVVESRQAAVNLNIADLLQRCLPETVITEELGVCQLVRWDFDVPFQNSNHFLQT